MKQRNVTVIECAIDDDGTNVNLDQEVSRYQVDDSKEILLICRRLYDVCTTS